MEISPAQLRQLRCQQGWTQRDLADHLDVDPVSVSRWERGLSRPRRGLRDRLRVLLVKMPTTTAPLRRPTEAALSPRVSTSERVDELVRSVGLNAALHALREIVLLSREPTALRFVDDPTKRMREVEAALSEQSALIKCAKIK